MSSPWFQRIAQWLARRLAFFVLLLAGAATSMAVSYGVVRYLTRDLTLIAVTDPELVRTATLLRSWSNELVDVMTAYLERVPLEAAAPKPSAKQWAAGEFRDRVVSLRQAMERQALWDLESYRRLRAAADRALSMVQHPADRELRRMVAKDITTAVATVEDHIRRNRVAAELPLPMRQPRFFPGS